MLKRLLDWTVLITLAILFHKVSCDCHQFFTILSQTFEPPIYALQTLDPDELPDYRLLNITDDEFNNCYISFSCHDEDDPECDNIIDKGSSFIPTEYSPITSETYSTEAIFPGDKATTIEVTDMISLSKNTTQTYNTQTKSSNDNTTEIYNTKTKAISDKTNVLSIGTKTLDATDIITQIAKPPDVVTTATYGTEMNSLSDNSTEMNSIDTESSNYNTIGTDSRDATHFYDITTETVNRGKNFPPDYNAADETKASLVTNTANVTIPTNITSADERANPTALTALCTVASICTVLIAVYFIAKKALILGQRGSYRTGEKPER